MPTMHQPSMTPPPEVALLPPLRQVPIGAPWRWLRAGWNDLAGTGFKGVLYGAFFALMGWLLATMYVDYWKLTIGLTTGFFLLGPFLCCGLYWLSRQRERGERVSFADSTTCWRNNPKSIGFFAIVLAFLLMIWARISAVVFALFATHEYPTLQGMVAQVFSRTNLDFMLAWFAVGFVFAAVAFAISVVSMPMMLDRGTDPVIATLTSMAVVANNVLPMLLWAVLIVVLIGASLVLGYVGLVITAPLVGHATWHAYRELVGESSAVAGSTTSTATGALPRSR